MAIKRTRESEEMYLETILLLHQGSAECARRGCARRTRLRCKSSVSRGVNLLEKKGYIHIDRDTGNLTFTDSGRKKAEGIYERHQTLTKALMKLGAGQELAEENACRMEHVVSDEMMEVFRNYIKE